jgi:hypothetical protein
LHGLGQIGREPQALFAEVMLDQLFQTWLINGNFSLAETGNFALIHIHTAHIVATFG